MIKILISACLIFIYLGSFKSLSAPIGKKTGVSFNKALPEDIFNDNYPDKIESFDFPNANLLDLVKAIGKFTGINFIVDPTIQNKKISIIAPSSITVSEAYKAFLSALAINGYTIIKSGAFWKIVNLEKAHKDNTEVYSGEYFPNTDQLITRIIKLNYINAKNFVTSIKWLLSQNNKISTHETSNSIILSDYGSVIERIMKIIKKMDIPGSEESIYVIPIQHASSEELSQILGNILNIKHGSRSRNSSYFSRNKRKTQINLSSKARLSSGNLKISSIIPDSRTNSLVVSANKEGYNKILNLIKKLDTPADITRTGGVYVYNVLHGTASEVYNTLMGIKPANTNSQNSSRHSLGFSYSSRRNYSSRRGSSSSPLFNNVIILADSNTNSLIISAKNKYDYEKVESVLRKIDVPRDQVFIQAIILEMIADNRNDKEVNLVGAVKNILQDSIKDKIPFYDILDSSIGGFLNKSFDIASLKNSSFGPGIVLGLPFLKFLEIAGFNSKKFLQNSNQNTTSNSQENQSVLNQKSQIQQALQTSFVPLIRLLKSSTNINILSTPQLTTLDNISAFIEVGEEAPVGISSTITAGVQNNSVSREKVVLKLEITPRINPASDTVRMDIQQKFDDFSNRVSSASELATKGVHITKREIKTTLVLHNGETAVLGGLLTDKEVLSENKVPILGDIPVLGWLFKGSNIKKEKHNLLVFITPTIIRGDQQKEKIQQILRKKLQERIHFIRKQMKGRDPHGDFLKNMISSNKIQKKKPLKDKTQKDKTQKDKKFKWFWESDSKTSKNLSKKQIYKSKKTLNPEAWFLKTDSKKSLKPANTYDF